MSIRNKKIYGSSGKNSGYYRIWFDSTVDDRRHVTADVYPEAFGTFGNVFTKENVYELLKNAVFDLDNKDSLLNLVKKNPSGPQLILSESEPRIKVYVGQNSKKPYEIVKCYLTDKEKMKLFFESALWNALKHAEKKGLLDPDPTKAKLQNVRVGVTSYRYHIYEIYISIL